MGVVKFLCLNGLTGIAGLALASRCNLESRAERLLAMCVFFVGIALASGLILGLSGHLQFWPALGLQAGVAALTAGVARREVMFDTLRPQRLWHLFGDRWLRPAMLIVGAAYLYVVFVGIISEPFAGDELMYHLPLVAAYAREGQITIPSLGKYWNTDLWAYYPGNAYLLYQWWVLPFGGGFLVDLVQLPYAFAAALATVVLARRLGARGAAALWSGVLFLAIPIVINQTKTAFVDVTLTFLFAAGLAFLLARQVGGVQLLLAAIAWGALPGAKVVGAMYVVLGMVCVAAHLATGASARQWSKRLVATGASLAAGVALLSGYWFIRNYHLTGSPIYPLNTDPGIQLVWSNVLFYGPILPLLDFTSYQPMFFYNYETGAGAQFVGLALPALVALMLAAWRGRRLDLAVLAAFPLVAYVFWLSRFSTSLHTLFRYLLPTMPVSFAAVGWFLQNAPRPRWVVTLALITTAFSVANAVPHVGTFLNPDSIRFGLAQLALGTQRLGRFDQMGDLALQDYRRAWSYLDGLPGEHNISVSHLIFTYPMLGTDFRNRVYSIEAPTREEWLQRIRAAKIDHVAIGQLLASNSSLIPRAGELQFRLDAENTGDEYTGAMRTLSPQSIHGLRLHYQVPKPASVNARIAINRFQHTVELPLDMPFTDREYTVDWNGEIKDFEVLLGFVRRGHLRDQLELNLSAMDLLLADGTTLRLPLDGQQWSQVDWPPEYYWMEDDPEHFRLAFRDQHFWATSHVSEMLIYEVKREGAR